MMVAITICPYCEKETNVEQVKANESVEVCGEIIEVEAEYFRCLECGGTFDDPASTHDPLAIAYQEYNRRHEGAGDFRKVV
jgi:hypothetical protein